MEVLSDIFEKRKNDSRWNTSYPLSPDDWKVYRISGELSFSGGNIEIRRFQKSITWSSVHYGKCLVMQSS